MGRDLSAGRCGLGIRGEWTVVSEWGGSCGCFVGQILAAAMPPKEKQCSDGDSTRSEVVPGGLLHYCWKDLFSRSAVCMICFEDLERCSECEYWIYRANGRVSLYVGVTVATGVHC